MTKFDAIGKTSNNETTVFISFANCHIGLTTCIPKGHQQRLEVYFLFTILFFDIINIVLVIFKAQMVKQRKMN